MAGPSHNPLYRLFFEGQPPSFEQYVEHEMHLIESGDPRLESGILRRGLYAGQVARYLECFDARQVLVLGFRELVEDPEKTIDTVTAFAHAGSEQRVTADRGTLPRNMGIYPSQCPEHVAHRLLAFYQPQNERPWHLLGRGLHW